MPNRSHNKTFIPLLCRFSQNDTVQPAKLPPTDPSSPKLTCIGQMKKNPTATTTTTINLFLSGHVKSSVHSNRYKLFSGKNIISSAIDTASIKKSNSCNGRGRKSITSKKYYVSRDDHDVVVAEELDPPFPVVKCRRGDQDVNVNLWKRRGIEMKTLQIQPIQLTMNKKTRNNNGGFSLPAASATTF